MGSEGQKTIIFVLSLQYIQKVLDEMSALPFQSIVQKEGGTQFKLIVEFPGGGQALFKPMRFTREQVCQFFYKTSLLLYDSLHRWRG